MISIIEKETKKVKNDNINPQNHNMQYTDGFSEDMVMIALNLHLFSILFSSIMKLQLSHYVTRNINVLPCWAEVVGQGFRV